MSNDTLHFLPYLRRGLAGLQDGAPSPEGGTITVTPRLTAQRGDGGQSETHLLDAHSFTLMGPGAVVGLKPDEVLRRSPPPGTLGVEPNYFVLAEFASADLPWRYTPGGPDAANRLQPWLALVVVEVRPGVTLTGAPGAQLQLLEIDDALRELPPLADAWSWAHVQYRGDIGPDPEATLATALSTRDTRLRSRLMCPRRLNPNTAYTACLVPTYEAGRRAGLGQTGSTDFSPAWPNTATSVTLPVYMSWRLTTGARGDFEALVKRLVPRQAGTIGICTLSTGAPGGGIPERPGAATIYAGALVSPSAAEHLQDFRETPDSAAQGLGKEIAAAVNAPLSATSAKPGEADPVVAPPAYGRNYTKGRAVSGELPTKTWFDTLNSLPAHRGVAGLGAGVARAAQEEFVDRAWDAARDISAANTRLNTAQLARGIGKVSEARTAQLDSDAARMRLAAPAFAAMPGANTARSVSAQLAASAIPDGLFAAQTRRATRMASPLSTQSSGAQPAAIAMTEAFLSAPLGQYGAFRDALAPFGVDPTATNAPVYTEDPTGLTAGTVTLQQPNTRQQDAFKTEPGTKGLVAAVTSAQDSAALLAGSLRNRIPALLQVAAPTPARLDIALEYHEPLYTRLRDQSLEALVPGVGDIPPDTATVLLPNPAFVRAFLVGLNHEMAREFLWREFPTRLDTTWFRRFWNAGSPDIDPISKWPEGLPLAGSEAREFGGEDLVLVLRGALPAHYPDFRLYAIPAKWDPDQVYRLEDDDRPAILPSFSGTLSEDVHFFGFPLSVSNAAGSAVPGQNAGYFFAFEEQPGAPRFGLEVAEPDASFGTAPDDWSTISWANVTPADSEAPVPFLTQDATNWMSDGVLRPGNGPAPDRWATEAATLARQTLQRPARVLMHASAMLP